MQGKEVLLKQSMAHNQQNKRQVSQDQVRSSKYQQAKKDLEDTGLGEGEGVQGKEVLLKQSIGSESTE